MNSGRLRQRLPEGGDITISADGRRLAIAAPDFHSSSGYQADIWDIAIGHLLRTLNDASGVLEGPLAFSPNGQLLATVGEDPHWPGPGTNPDGGAPSEAAYAHTLTVKMWDVGSGRRLRILPGQFNNSGQTLQFTPDGRRLISTGTETNVWSVATGQREHHSEETSLLVSPAGVMALTDAHSHLHLIDLATGTHRTLSKAFSTPAYTAQAAFSPSGNYLATLEDVGTSSALRLWDLRRGRALWLRALSLGSLYDLRFSPDGRSLLLRTPERIEQRDVRNGHLVNTTPESAPDHPETQLSPNGTLVADVSRFRLGRRTIVVRNLKTGISVQTFTIPGYFDGGFSFSPNGKVLAVPYALDQDYNVGGLEVARSYVGLWDIASGRLARTLTGPLEHTGIGTTLFSSDGKRLAFSSGGQVSLFDSATGGLVQTIRPESGGLEALALSPHATRIFTQTSIMVASDQHETTLRRVRDGKVRATLISLSSDDRPATDWITITPDGHYTASPGAERVIRWRIGNRLYPASRYASTYHRPGLVRRALSGN